MRSPSSSSRNSLHLSPSMADASCPACLLMYTDSDPLRMPRVPPLCGHSMCTECVGKVRACVVCRKQFYGDSSLFRVNYPLMGLVTELVRQSGETMSASETCAGCGSRSAVERLRACRACAKSAKTDLKKANKEKILDFIFCPECAIEKHIEENHLMDKYMDYFNRAEMTSLTERVHKDIATVKEQVESTSADAQKGVTKWISDVNRVCAAGLKIRTASDCIGTKSKVETEIKKIQEATEDLLKAQRVYMEKTKDSSTELKKILDDVEKKRRSAGFFSFFRRFNRSSSRPKKALPPPVDSIEETTQEK